MHKIHTNRNCTLKHELKNNGFAFLSSNEIQVHPQLERSFNCLGTVLEDSPTDGATRRRYYGRYSLGPNTTSRNLNLRPGSAHFLSSDYQQASDMNPEQKGELRKFAPLPPAATANTFLKQLLLFDWALLPMSEFWVNAKRNPLLVGIHLIRMSATLSTPGIATPNCPHQDGEPFTFVHLLNRHGVVGGESQVFQSVITDGVARPGREVLNATLQQPLDTLVIWDRAVFHHVTPIEVATGFSEGVRDVILIDFTPLEEAKLSSGGTITFNPNNFRIELGIPIGACGVMGNGSKV